MQSVQSVQQPVPEQPAPVVQQAVAQSTLQPQIAASSETTTTPVSQEPQIQVAQVVQPEQQPVQEKPASTVQQTPVQVAKEMSDRPRIHIPANLNRVPHAVVLSETDNPVSEPEKAEAVSEESDMVDTSKLVRPDVASADQVNKYQEFDEKPTDKKKNKKRGRQKIMHILLLAVGAALVNNVILSQFLGLCPFLGVSKSVNTATGMGGAVIFVMTIASAVTSIVYYGILSPLGLDYLNTIVFILVIAALVQFVEMFLKKNMKSLYESLGVYLPLITTNCAVLGIALSNVQNEYTILESIVNGFGSAVGFAISITILAGIREKLEYSDIPEAFKGTPIVLITSGLMAIAFFGFAGLI